MRSEREMPGCPRIGGWWVEDTKCGSEPPGLFGWRVIEPNSNWLKQRELTDHLTGSPTPPSGMAGCRRSNNVHENFLSPSLSSILGRLAQSHGKDGLCSLAAFDLRRSSLFQPPRRSPPRNSDWPSFNHVCSSRPICFQAGKVF